MIAFKEGGAPTARKYQLTAAVAVLQVRMFTSESPASLQDYLTPKVHK